ncbi:hypothetical protein [Bacteroidetes bacterium endosymbiont of Geopemphigus sp.]
MRAILGKNLKVQLDKNGEVLIVKGFDQIIQS